MAKKIDLKKALQPLSSELPLPPEEWDFHDVQKEHLLMATEYEDARSGPHRQIIEEWLDKPFSHLIGECWKSLPLEPMREAGLVKFTEADLMDQETTRTLPAHSTESPFASVSPHEGVSITGVRRTPSQVTWPEGLSVRGVIAGAFEKITDKDVRRRILETLGSLLPEPLVRARLDRIAILFDLFPVSFVTLERDCGPGYLEARRRVSSNPDFAIREISPWRMDELQDTWPDIASIQMPIGPLIEPMAEGQFVRVTQAPRAIEPQPASRPGKPPLQHHLFLVNWTRSPKEIKEEFSAWLMRNHHASSGGNPHQGAHLRRLAAYRLTGHGWTCNQLLDHLDDYKHAHGISSPTVGLPDYKQEAEWSEAVNAAKSALAGDYILAIRDDFPASAWIGIL